MSGINVGERGKLPDGTLQGGIYRGTRKGEYSALSAGANKVDDERRKLNRGEGIMYAKYFVLGADGKPVEVSDYIDDGYGHKIYPQKVDTHNNMFVKVDEGWIEDEIKELDAIRLTANLPTLNAPKYQNINFLHYKYMNYQQQDGLEQKETGNTIYDDDLFVKMKKCEELMSERCKNAEKMMENLRSDKMKMILDCACKEIVENLKLLKKYKDDNKELDKQIKKIFENEQNFGFCTYLKYSPPGDYVDEYEDVTQEEKKMKRLINYITKELTPTI
jgi:hypothetical protein